MFNAGELLTQVNDMFMFWILTPVCYYFLKVIFISLSILLAYVEGALWIIFGICLVNDNVISLGHTVVSYHVIADNSVTSAYDIIINQSYSKFSVRVLLVDLEIWVYD